MVIESFARVLKKRRQLLNTAVLEMSSTFLVRKNAGLKADNISAVNQ